LAVVLKRDSVYLTYEPVAQTCLASLRFLELLVAKTRGVHKQLRTLLSVLRSGEGVCVDRDPNLRFHERSRLSGADCSP